MKDICKRLNIDTKIYRERALLSAISSAKDELIGPEEYRIRAQGDFGKMKTAAVYEEYQRQLKQNNALDFDDLICKTVELFQENPDVLDYYQEKFRYIMVDEYQDTNTAQFRLVSILASKYRNLCVVGDDDQSIYKFRGANIGNILNFEQFFPDAKVIKLEQNYRSTQNILDAANGVIANNSGRRKRPCGPPTERENRCALGSFPQPTTRRNLLPPISAKKRQRESFPIRTARCFTEPMPSPVCLRKSFFSPISPTG